MDREEEIRERAKCLNTELAQKGFILGARWADEHPKSAYNISDTDYVASMLEGIIEEVNFLTTGNVAHNKAAIRFHAMSALNAIKAIEK